MTPANQLTLLIASEEQFSHLDEYIHTVSVTKKVLLALLINFENDPILMVYCYSVTNQTVDEKVIKIWMGLYSPNLVLEEFLAQS